MLRFPAVLSALVALLAAAPAAPAAAADVNVALFGHGGTASSSSELVGYPTAALNDGVRQVGIGYWNDATNATYPDHAQIAWDAPRPLKSVVLRLPVLPNHSEAQRTIGRMTLLWRGADGTWTQAAEIVAWTAPTATDGNEARAFALGVEATAVRVVFDAGNGDGWSLLEEIEAYGDSGPINLALGRPVSASSTLGGYAAASVTNGVREVGSGYWNDGTPGDYTDDWVRVDLDGPQEVQEVVLRMPVLNTEHRPEQAVQGPLVLQWLDGETWKDVAADGNPVTTWTVPRGASDGTEARRFTFAPLTTTALRVKYAGGNSDGWVYLEELEAYGAPAVTPAATVPVVSAGAVPSRTGELTLAWGTTTGGTAERFELQGRRAGETAYSDLYSGTSAEWVASPALAEGRWHFRVRAIGTDFDAAWAESAEVVVDKTAPTARIDARDPEYVGGDGTKWWADAVTLSFAGMDPPLADLSAGSGIDAASVPAATTVSTTGAHEVAGTVRDHAGNESARATQTVHVDADAPVAALTCPAEPVLLDAAAVATWAATDAGAGLPSASGEVALDTSTILDHTATTPAIRDHVGHLAAEATCGYRVIYDWRLLDPIAAPPTWNVVRAGDTVPVRFSLGREDALDVVTRSDVQPVECTDDAHNRVADTLPDTADDLTHDGTAYTCALRTDAAWGGECRQVVLHLEDGTAHTMRFKLLRAQAAHARR